MNWLDLPPVWLLACLGSAWVWRSPGFWDGAFWPGVVLLAIAGALAVAAILEFARARTTIIPHRSPAALITSGIFRVTRNPIYLADVLILASFALIWGSLPGLVLVPALWWLLSTRFIESEEKRLAAAFGAEFNQYAARTRRWI